MTLFVDEPRWSAHGTLFAHLVCDGDLGELHQGADRLGLSVRAFDLDHYDLPAGLLDTAVAEGAVPVSRTELLRVLTRGGTRVPGARRAAREREDRAADLARRWERLGARVSPAVDTGAWLRLGAELVERWAEPHRRYHDDSHLAAVLDRLDLLTGDVVPEVHPSSIADRPAIPRDGAVPPAVALAAWFHDAVHDGAPVDGAPTDEEASAALARDRLGALGLTEPAPDAVASLVLGTVYDAGPETVAGSAGRSQPEAGRVTGSGAGRAAGDVAGEAVAGATGEVTGEAAGVATGGMSTVVEGSVPRGVDVGDLALLTDADLAVLAGDARSYRRYVRGVREEYPHLDEDEFRRGRSAVLQALLSRPSLFSTATGRARWEARARANLESELAALGVLDV